MPVSKNINKDFFKFWSNNMAYILGFMFADGGIVKNNRGAYYFSLYSSDKKLLEEIRNKMSSEHKISKRNVRSGNVFRLQVGSKEMINDLSKHGFYSNKIYRMRLPDIPFEFISAFARGYFDGDGNVWVGLSHKNKGKSNIAIQTSFTSASKLFLNDLKNILSRFNILGGSIFLIKNKNCYRLTYSVNDSLKLYNLMYNRDNYLSYDLFLLRKRKVFEKYDKLRKMRS